MGSAYGISDCIGWYLAGTGVFTDAGATPAHAGDPVAQWNDQSGAGNHLVQPTAANRPTLHTGGNPAGVEFDDAAATALNLPASFSLPTGAVTVLLCTRGVGAALINVGSVTYGGLGVGGTVALIATDGTSRTAGAFLPITHAIVHGFVADGGSVTLRTGTAASITAAGVTVSTAAGGVLGRSPGSTAAGFTGAVLELAIFGRALGPLEVQNILTAMQASNGLPTNADTNLLLLIGDEQIAGDAGAPFYDAFPYWLDRTYAGSFSPLQTASAGQTCATQLAALQSVLPVLNLQSLSYRMAVISCGLNDVLNDGCTAAEGTTRFTALVQALRTVLAVRVIAAVPLLQAGAAGVSASQQAAVDTFRDWLRAGAGGAVDGVVDWTADPRLADAAPQPVFRSGAVQTTDTGSRVKAALIKPAIDAQISASPLSPDALSYGSFYATSRSFSGTFGAFLRA